MKLCWLQAEILGGRFMQTSTRTPRENIPKMFSRGFVTNENLWKTSLVYVFFLSPMRAGALG